MLAGMPQPSQRVTGDTGGMRSSSARSTWLRLAQRGEHAAHVARADDGDHAPARRFAHALREIGVAFVDQHALERGQVLGELGHHAREHVLLAQLAQVVLGQLRLLEHARQEGGEQQRLLPQRERGPGSPQGHAHVAVAQGDRDAEALGRPARLEQLGPGLHARARPPSFF